MLSERSTRLKCRWKSISIRIYRGYYFEGQEIAKRTILPLQPAEINIFARASLAAIFFARGNIFAERVDRKDVRWKRTMPTEPLAHRSLERVSSLSTSWVAAIRMARSSWTIILFSCIVCELSWLKEPDVFELVCWIMVKQQVSTTGHALISQ